MLRTTALACALAVVVLAGTAVAGAPVDTDAATLIQGATHVVAPDGSGDYSTIGAAVEASSDGDTVVIRPGTYAESVIVDKDITLTGDGPREDIILSVDAGPILRILRSDAVVSGLTFTGSASKGVRVDGGSPRLEDLAFRSVGKPWQPGFTCRAACDSLMLSGGSSAIVRDSSFDGGGGIWVAASAPLIESNELTGGTALVLWDAHDGAVVRDNAITAALGNAISVYEGEASVTVQGNVIVGAGASGISVGLGPLSGVDPIIRDNSISEATNGITVMSRAEPTIEGNHLFGNGTGIVVSNADPTIARNKIHDNGSGVFVMWGAPLLDGNDISGGHVGLGLGTPGARPILEDNTIVANDLDMELMFSARMPDTAGNRIGAVEIDP